MTIPKPYLISFTDALEIDAVRRHQSIGHIDGKAAWLGETGEITVTVPATKR